MFTRDIAPKLEKLNRRKQRAIVEMLREKLAKEAAEASESSSGSESGSGSESDSDEQQ